MKGYTDMKPHVVLKRVINIELSEDELNILLDAIYFLGAEMEGLMVDTEQMKQLSFKLHKARKLARGE